MHRYYLLLLVCINRSGYKSSGGAIQEQQRPLSHFATTTSFNKILLQSTGSEVDRHILSMMTESSVDFTNKFARLADAVVYSNESTSPAEDDE